MPLGKKKPYVQIILNIELLFTKIATSFFLCVFYYIFIISHIYNSEL